LDPSLNEFEGTGSFGAIPLSQVFGGQGIGHRQDFFMGIGRKRKKTLK